mmetsp:Transcript_11413/g.33879  ORF Transcript_11413/g.33879 Transcript_11413/m.33879 type:complete len:218 (+) Transcript_11413:1041-1694(+)
MRITRRIKRRAEYQCDPSTSWRRPSTARNTLRRASRRRRRSPRDHRRPSSRPRCRMLRLGRGSASRRRPGGRRGASTGGATSRRSARAATRQGRTIANPSRPGQAAVTSAAKGSASRRGGRSSRRAAPRPSARPASPKSSSRRTLPSSRRASPRFPRTRRGSGPTGSTTSTGRRGPTRCGPTRRPRPSRYRLRARTMAPYFSTASARSSTTRTARAW